MKNLITIDALSENDVLLIFKLARSYIQKDYRFSDVLKNKVVLSAFFEDSTRTSKSFEVSSTELGAKIISFTAGSSSMKKGETLSDTAKILDGYKPDIFIARHGDSGSMNIIQKSLSCPLINAGEGKKEHPTQALIDAMVMFQKKGALNNLTVAICGDIMHSRVARSNIKLLKKMGAHVRLAGPPTLIPQELTNDTETFFSMKDGLANCDVVMMLRMQQERMKSDYISSIEEYSKFYCLNDKLLSRCKKDALIMHPGPVNRDIDICSPIMDNNPNSVIFYQAEVAVAVRKAILDFIINY